MTSTLPMTTPSLPLFGARPSVFSWFISPFSPFPAAAAPPKTWFRWNFFHAVQCQLGAKTYQLGDFGRKKRRRLPPAAAGGIKSNPSFPVTGAAEMTLLMPEGPTISLEIEALPACYPLKKWPATFLKKGLTS